MNRYLNKEEDGDLYFWNFVKNSSLPTMEEPVCQLVTAEQWDDPSFKRILKDINKKKVFHRKQWELVYVINCLQKHNKLEKGNFGLGFACGKELLPSYFASKGCKITASDQSLENAGNWSLTNQHSNSVEDLFYESYVNRADFEKNVCFKNVDMNCIPEELFDSFDFCWSICAMEHIGGLKKGVEFVKKSLKCLKVGGVAIHTTEFNLSSNDKTFNLKNNCAFRHKDIINMLKSLGDDYEYKTNFNIGTDEFNFFVDFERNDPNKHLKIETLGFIITCFGLIIKRVK